MKYMHLCRCDKMQNVISCTCAPLFLSHRATNMRRLAVTSDMSGHVFCRALLNVTQSGSELFSKGLD